MEFGEHSCGLWGIYSSAATIEQTGAPDAMTGG